MWHKNNRRRGFLGHLKSLFGQKIRSNPEEIPERLDVRITRVSSGFSATYVQNHVLITFNHGASYSSEQLEAAGPDSETKPLGSYGVALMELSTSTTVDQAIKALKQLRGFELQNLTGLESGPATPSDPSFGVQWGLQNIGQT